MFPSFNNNNNQNWQKALNQNAPGGYPYDPYQVKQGDTFDNIAQNTGFDVPAIQQANGGMLVPPPKGSFINIPKLQTSSNAPNQYLHFPGVAPNQSSAPFYTQAQLPPGTRSVSPVRPSGITGVPPVGYGPQQAQPQTPPNLGTGVMPSGYGLSAAPPEYVAQVQANINQQVASGSMPGIVPLNTPILNPQTGQPVTPSQMVANGYTLNQQSGQWVLSGANTTGPGTLPGGQGGASTAGSTDFTNTGFMQNYIQKGTAFTEQKRWDPERKKFIKIGQLINEGRLDPRSSRLKRSRRGGGGGGAQQQVAPAAPEGFRGGPTEQLNTNRGGG